MDVYSSRVTRTGTIVIPKELRKRLGIVAGDRLTVFSSPGIIALQKPDVRKLEKAFANWERAP